MPPETISLDVDLRKVYAWSDRRGMLLNGAEFPTFDILVPCRVLMEIASPVDYNEVAGVAYQKRRWMLFNMAVAGMLCCTSEDAPIKTEFLVAPSSKWTKGYSHDARWKMAGIERKGKKWAHNKDIRECIAMQWFFKQTPTDWVSFDTYLEKL